MPQTKVRTSNGMNALDKVIAILEAFLVESEELRLSDLCRLTGLNKSTCYVITQSLVERGYLTQSGKRGTYFLGLRFIELANVVRNKLNIADVALPYMNALNAETNETVELTVRDGAFCTVVNTVIANRLLTASGTGKWAARIPLHNTACGKTLLAFMDPEEYKLLKPKLKLTADTPNTVVSFAALEAQLAKIRAEGVAIDNEEAELGMRSLGAPVLDSHGEVIAALDIIGPKSRFTTKEMTDYRSLLKDYALKISIAMGYNPNK